MILDIAGGTFDSEDHLYRDQDGRFCPSLTQVLKLQGLSDYSGIDEAVLENAARRGSEVHELAAAYNQFGEVDPSWISDETRPYFDAYMQFLADTGFKPDPAWVERPMIATIHGFKLGITPDCFGKLRRDQVVLEFKCTATRQPSWTIQTCLQEMGIFNSNRCGRVRRYALMLMKTGKYNLGDEHTDHESDMSNGIAALRNVHWRLAHGQNLHKKLIAQPALAL